MPLFRFTVAAVLIIYTVALLGEEIISFQGNTLKMTNSFNKTLPNCSQEIAIYSPEVAPLPRRLASCNNSEYWAKNATVFPGTVTNETKISFRLQRVTFICSQVNNLWHASLKVSAVTTTGHEPPFREIIFMLRCRDVQSSDRLVKTYLVKTDTAVTDVPLQYSSLMTSPEPTHGTADTAVTDVPLNSNVTTLPPSPSEPAHGTADHKTNLGMAIGVPVGIAVVAVLLVVAWACYRHRERLSSWISKTNIQCYRPKNNNIETAELEHIQL